MIMDLPEIVEAIIIYKSQARGGLKRFVISEIGRSRIHAARHVRYAVQPQTQGPTLLGINCMVHVAGSRNKNCIKARYGFLEHLRE